MCVCGRNAIKESCVFRVGHLVSPNTITVSNFAETSKGVNGVIAITDEDGGDGEGAEVAVRKRGGR